LCKQAGRIGGLKTLRPKDRNRTAETLSGSGRSLESLIPLLGGTGQNTDL
jgi:hypothetical protein